MTAEENEILKNHKRQKNSIKLFVKAIMNEMIRCIEKYVIKKETKGYHTQKNKNYDI